MRINKTNLTEIKINKDGVIYALAFLLYFIAAVLIFIYATNSLRTVINTALSTPDNTEIENKYGQLDLENYSLVASKLGLKKPEQTPIDIVPEAAIETTTEEQIISTTSEEVITPTTTVEVIVTETPKIEEKKPTIIINNSTLKSGLAASLKNKLASSGYTVIGTGNTKPAEATTLIKVKSTISQDSTYLDEIKKIVDLNYDFEVSVLDDLAKSDVEIVIGNK